MPLPSRTASSAPVAAVVFAGLLAAATAAAAVRGPHPHVSRSPFLLTAPQLEAPLLSGIPATLRPSCRYTGHGRLVFSLAQGPAGMTAEPDSGILTWTPPAATEGQQFTVTESVSDGGSTASITFTVAVASATQVSTSVAATTITVTQAGTLQGLAVTLPAAASLPPAQVKVSTVTPGQAPPLPEGVTRISDFFRVTSVTGTSGMITLTLPTSGVPAGRSAQDVRLFVYTDAAANVGPGDSIEGPAWIRTWYGFDVLPSGKAMVKLRGVGDLSFIGVDVPATLAPVPVASTGTVDVGAGSASYSCSPFLLANGLPAANIQVCALTGAVTLTVTVKDFSRLRTSPAATRDELLGWLVAARKAFSDLGLGADATVDLVVEPMPAGTGWLGFVTTGNFEDQRVIHITNAPRTKPEIQATAGHEYFHHAQSRTTAEGKMNLMDAYPNTAWMAEGTARWFEDYVFDDLDTYQSLNHNPLLQILLFGLAALDNEKVPETWPYDRFAFWKMIESSCAGFSLPEIFTWTTLGTTCLTNFKSMVESGAWECNFDLGFGEANRATLASALLYYTYATTKVGDIGLLDGNEPYLEFQEPSGWQLLQPSPDCPGFDDCPAGSLLSSYLAPASAIAFVVGAVPTLEPGQAATLAVKSTNGREVWVWTGDTEQPGGLAGGAWSKTKATWTNLYATSGRAPKTMVVVVNPDTSTGAGFSIRTSIAQTLFVMPDWKHGVTAPIFVGGPPDHDFTLVAMNGLPWPASYTIRWDFGDGSPRITVANADAVAHRWAAVGEYPVTAEVFEQPADTLVSRGAGTARITYFEGEYRFSTFSGSSSGAQTFHSSFFAGIETDPAAGTFEYSSQVFSAAGRETDAWMNLEPEGEDRDTITLGSTDRGFPDSAADCPYAFAAAGNTLLLRTAGPLTPDIAGWCLETSVTQVGARISGTVLYWEKSYQQDDGGHWVLKNQGQDSYSFEGAYTGN